VNVLDDAQVVIKKEKAEESKKSEASGQLFNILISYTNRLKMNAGIERNLLQASQLAKKIDLSSLFHGGSQQNNRLKQELRPQNIVRFYEKALKSMRSIVNMEKDALDPAKAMEIEFQEKLYSTYIRYYIALHYANEKKYQECYVLLAHCSTQIEETIELAQRNGLQG